MNSKTDESLPGHVESNISNTPSVSLTESIGISSKDTTVDYVNATTNTVSSVTAEDSAADTDMNVVMTDTGKLIEVQGTAEEAPFSFDEIIFQKRSPLSYWTPFSIWNTSL